MVFGLAEVSGTTCSTSQCSTILPASSSRKMSMPAQSLLASVGHLLVAVQHDEVSLGDDALEGDVLARVVPGHALEVGDEALLAVGDVRVVLGVAGTCVRGDRVGRPAGVEHRLVEGDDGVLVALQRVDGGHGVGGDWPASAQGLVITSLPRTWRLPMRA
jgi:hypothetical protein